MGSRSLPVWTNGEAPSVVWQAATAALRLHRLGLGATVLPRVVFWRCPYVMCGRRVWFWEDHAATELQPFSLQRVPVLRIPEGTLLFSHSPLQPQSAGPPHNGGWRRPRSKALKSDTFPCSPAWWPSLCLWCSEHPSWWWLHFDLPPPKKTV